MRLDFDTTVMSVHYLVLLFELIVDSLFTKIRGIRDLGNIVLLFRGMLIGFISPVKAASLEDFFVRH